tara:strand:+ start:775 stop:930 length:156 start_codon:yes stop_codon:yes gene_type:complete
MEAIRNEISQLEFNKDYADLNEEQKLKIDELLGDLETEGADEFYSDEFEDY